MLRYISIKLRGIAPIGVMVYWSDGYKEKDNFSARIGTTPIHDYSISMAPNKEIKAIIFPPWWDRNSLVSELKVTSFI